MQPRRLRWYFSCTLSAACRAERSGLMHAGRRMLTCVERFSPGAGPGECSLETSHPSCSGRPDCGRSAVLRTRRPMLPGPGIERLFLPSVLAVRSKAAWSNRSITRLPWNKRRDSGYDAHTHNQTRICPPQGRSKLCSVVLGALGRRWRSMPPVDHHHGAKRSALRHTQAMASLAHIFLVLHQTTHPC
jgi:hypothetical protein